MKRIAITIMHGKKSKYPLSEYLFDASEFCDYSPGESVENDSAKTMVWYHTSEVPFEIMLRDSSSKEKYEMKCTEISDAEWNEIKTAMDDLDDDAAFFERMKLKYRNP